MSTAIVLPVMALRHVVSAREALSFSPVITVERLDIVQKDYKTLRLEEMAKSWKGTNLEKHTVPLLAMLLQEDGTLTAERRHDCHKGVCYGIGFMGHSICSRGTPLIYYEATGKRKHYCTWVTVNGEKISPQKQFERDYPEFSTEWRIQFDEYTLRMSQCVEKKRVETCIQDWNSREVGRLGKVKKHYPLVMNAISRVQ